MMPNLRARAALLGKPLVKLRIPMQKQPPDRRST
ncbi:hypothetical protein ThimaDRAFT_3227 [Thiocapsa marina 5811]|uniref:Uncharacterized protein n=1 Tax=Thiocapsa marina 5811 TaxID=768671 RepID=F9UDN5_9GAMM|nr:hypothetical protein ThimaDRAFT_3227 [Thiocapsa marina 5811]